MTAPSPAAQVRSSIYAFLAHVLAQPEAGPLPQAWQTVAAALPVSLANQAEQLAATATDNGALTSAYQRLFIGPARPRVYPHESCYRHASRRLAGPWAEQVAAHYAAEGLACLDLLPDHIAAELAFMAHLAGGEANALAARDQASAELYRQQQAAFLRQHLLLWAPAFCRQVQQATDHPFYSAVAQFLSAWLEQEAADLGLASAADTPPAYPSAIVARLCTLCGVCAEVCEPQALRLARTPDAAQLSLHVDGCTGCRLCAEVCPFKALRLSSEPASGVLASSPLLPCPDCGQPGLPEAFWERLTRRLDPSEPAAVAARRCLACKPLANFDRILT